MQHVLEALLDRLYRSLEAFARGPSFPLEVPVPGVRAAQEAAGLWPSLPVLDGVSVGKAPKRDQARLFRDTCQPTLLQPLFQ